MTKAADVQPGAVKPQSAIATVLAMLATMGGSAAHAGTTDSPVEVATAASRGSDSGACLIAEIFCKSLSPSLVGSIVSGTTLH